jgi:hypothetical protein
LSNTPVGPGRRVWRCTHDVNRRHHHICRAVSAIRVT